MKKQYMVDIKKGVLRYTKDFERGFFFYATLGMFILYGITSLFSG